MRDNYFGKDGMIVLLLYFIVVVQSQILVCQDETDYYQWLYGICIQSSPCRQLYYLYPILGGRSLNQIKETPEKEAFVAYRNSKDFSLFQHQLSRILIFQINSTDERRLVLKGLVPDTWLPNLTIILRNNTALLCSDNDTIDPSVAIVALYSMHLYKMVLSDEFFCHDPNERLLLDPLTNATICVCKKNKSCDNDSHFDFLITFLVTLLIFGMIINTISIFASLFHKRRLLYGL